MFLLSFAADVCGGLGPVVGSCIWQLFSFPSTPNGEKTRFHSDMSSLFMSLQLLLRCVQLVRQSMGAVQFVGDE